MAALPAPTPPPSRSHAPAAALLLVLVLGPSAVYAAPSVPVREIPASTLVELQALENRFDIALSADCAADRCSSNGCVYLDHAVADQPRRRSLPGLGEEAGPGSVAPQEYLTRASCTFSHEATVDAADAAAIVQRLQTRLSRGWTVVTVARQALPPIPSTVRPPAPPAPEVTAPTTPTTEDEGVLSRLADELWQALLPHSWWMVGVGLFTMAATVLIWAARRVGRGSFEEQALLAQLSQPGGGGTDPPGPTDRGSDTPAPGASPESEAAEELEGVRKQEASWRMRLGAVDPAQPNPELVALVRERLRAGDLPLLAKAVLRFPDTFPLLFPQDGELAAAKLELAGLLQNGDAESLPSDAVFFRSLERHALAATLASQPDARVVKRLREDFGVAGLVTLIGGQPARVGALLFAVAPAVDQHEAVRLLDEGQIAELCRQLLRSNRMDPREVTAMLDAVRSSATDGAPKVPPAEITDRGATFDAAGALAVLLPELRPEGRASLFDEALARFSGQLPRWYQEIMVPDMLSVLSAEARADLLLGVEVEALSAWLASVGPAPATQVLAGAPESLRRSLGAVRPAGTAAAQQALAREARVGLARSFQTELARAGLAFEAVVRGA